MNNWILSDCFLDSCAECHCKPESERVAYFTCTSWCYVAFGITSAAVSGNQGLPFYMFLCIMVFCIAMYELLKNTYCGIRLSKFISIEYEGTSMGNSFMNVVCGLVGFFFGYVYVVV